MTPLHYACKANNITLAVMLATGPRGKLALLSTSQTGERPVDLVKNNLLLYRLESKLTFLVHILYLNYILYF